MNSFAVLDEYLDIKEECLTSPDNQGMLIELEDVFIEINKIENSFNSEQQKKDLAFAYCQPIYDLLKSNPFLICAYFLEETAVRSSKSLVALVFLRALKEYVNRYGQPDAMFTLAELCRVRYFYERNNDSFVHDLYKKAAQKGHKMAFIRLRQEQEIKIAHKCVMTPFDKGVIYSHNVSRGIGIYRSLFEQGRLDVVPELLRACQEIKAYSIIKEVLFFLDNDSYTRQFMDQVSTLTRETYLKNLHKLYKKAKWHVLADKISNVIRVILYLLLILVAANIFFLIKNEPWYYILSFYFVYFTIGKFVVERPLFSLFILPLSLIGSFFSGIGDADWDTLGEALIISSII